MKRRTLMASGLAAAIALAVSGQDRPVQAQAATVDVLVVGAGAAGIAAASTLAAQGYAVVVLEARERIGGRVWSDRSWTPAAADMGASWIQGPRGNPLTALAESASQRTVEFDYDAYTAFRSGGQPVSERALANAERTAADLLDEAAALAEEHEVDLPLRDVVDAAWAARSTPARDRALVEFLLHTTIAHEYAADLDQLSAWWWDGAEAFPGTDLLLPDGYISLFEPLAAGLDIRLQTPVTALRHNRRGVVAETASGDLAARAAVVTLPLALLQQDAVAFAPALPAGHRSAIRRLGMGLLNKCFLEFPSTFWDTETHLIGYAGARDGLWAEWVNMTPATGLPLLLGFNAAAAAEGVETLDDEATVASAMAALRDMFGSDVPDPVSWRISRWRSDSWAGGSYSCFAVGSSPDDCALLATPAGPRLLLAGEHTHAGHPATVHGAWLSGLRAARQAAGMLTD